MSASELDVSAMSFEDALRELEEIVRGLEEGETSLEASVEAYARGVALKEQCEAKLAEAKMRVEKITIAKDGTASSEPAEID